MNSYDLLAAEVHKLIETLANTVDDVAPGLDLASSALLGCLMQDRKILICAVGDASSVACEIADTARQGNDLFPSIPCLSVTCPNADSPAAFSQWWTELRTLCRDGDVVLLLDSEPGASLTMAVCGFSQERNLELVALSDRREVPDAISVPLTEVPANFRLTLLRVVCQNLFMLLQKRMLGELDASSP